MHIMLKMQNENPDDSDGEEGSVVYMSAKILIILLY